MNSKNPLTLWIIVGICFSIIVIAWAPLAFKRMNDLFGSLFRETINTSQDVQGLWKSQGKQKFESVVNQVSIFTKSTQKNQAAVTDFSQLLKDQLFQNASSSATSTQ